MTKALHSNPHLDIATIEYMLTILRVSISDEIELM